MSHRALSRRAARWPATHTVTITPAAGLTGLVAVLAAAAALSGLFADGLYRDNAYTIANGRGNDLVTLLIVPLLVGAYVAAVWGSRRARLVWLGVRWYMVYTYAFYLFGSALNAAFPLHAALIVAALGALALGVMRTDVHGLARRSKPSVPVREMAVHLAVAALGLAVAWLAQWAADYALNDRVPQIMTDTGWKTSVVFGLDFTVAIPTMLAAWLLWRRRPWGYLLGAILGVKGVLYATVLLVTAAYQADRGDHDAWSFAPVSAFLLLGSAFVLGGLLTGLRKDAR